MVDMTIVLNRWGSTLPPDTSQENLVWVGSEQSSSTFLDILATEELGDGGEVVATGSSDRTTPSARPESDSIKSAVSQDADISAGVQAPELTRPVMERHVRRRPNDRALVEQLPVDDGNSQLQSIRHIRV